MPGRLRCSDSRSFRWPWFLLQSGSWPRLPPRGPLHTPVSRCHSRAWPSWSERRPEPHSEDVINGTAPCLGRVTRMNEDMQIWGRERNGHESLRRIRGPRWEDVCDIRIGLQIISMEEQLLQFRRQGTSGNLEAAVRGSELGERIGHRLACDHQDAGCQDHEGEQERGSRVHENTTTRGMIECP